MSQRALLFLVTIASAMAITSGRAEAEVVVIGHRSVPADTITKAQLTDIYTGEMKTWSNGAVIVPFELKTDSNTRTQFYDYINQRSSRLKSIWMRNLLLGEGKPPEARDSEEEIVTSVASTPGALGFVSADSVSGDVKVLAEIKDND